MRKIKSSEGNRIEEFKLNSNLNLKKFNLITFFCEKNDFRISVNNNLDILFSYNKKLKIDKNLQKKLITIYNYNKNYFLFDIFSSNNCKIDFSNYYRKSLMTLNNIEKENDFIPFENYEKHEEYKSEFTILQGTKRNYYDVTLDYRIEGKLTPKKKSNFKFKKFLKKSKNLVLSFDLKNNPIYPKQTNFIQRKQIYFEIKNLLSNYIFVHRSLTILSPPIYEEEQNPQMKFIHSNELLRKDEFHLQYPLYGISYYRFSKFVRKFFNVSNKTCETLLNLIKHSPYLLEVFSNVYNCKVEIFVYDKALQFYVSLFLEESEENEIKDQLIRFNNFLPVYLDPDDHQRKLFVNKIVQIGDLTHFDVLKFDVFLKKNCNFSMIGLSEVLGNQDLFFEHPVKVIFKDIQNLITNVEIVYEGKSVEYNIPMKLMNCERIEIDPENEFFTSVNLYQDEFFSILKMSIITNKRTLAFSVKNCEPNIQMTEKCFPLKYRMINFHILNQNDDFCGIFFTFNTDILEISPEGLKNDFLTPRDFSVENFDSLDLRFDISIFDKKQFEKYVKTISVLKYDLEAYLKNCNESINFLESIFPKCSIYTNYIRPMSIGDFRIFILGVGDQKNLLNIKNKKKRIFQNKITLFSNKEINQFPTSEEIYDNFCYLLIKNGDINLLCEKQSHFFIKNKIKNISLKREKVQEETLNIDTYLINRKNDFQDSSELICRNYGCNKKFIKKENEKCLAHEGSWDFGHTGVTIEETLKEYKKKKSKKILWKPHWTCCGLNWEENCKKIHEHNGSRKKNKKNNEINFENTSDQKIFTKNVRDTWIQQLDKFYKLDKKGIKKKIRKLARNLHVNYKEIKIEFLPKLCDLCNLHLLVINRDMSYHFKFLELVNEKAFVYLKTKEGFIDVGKFLEWWFCSLEELGNFS